MVTTRIHLATLLLSVAAIAAVELTAAALPNTAGLPLLAVTGINRILEIALLTAVVTWANRGLASIGISAATLLPGFRRGIVWSAGFGAAAGVGFLILYLFSIRPLDLIGIKLPEQPQNIILLFIIGGVIAPVAEEIFFRGILFGYLRRWGAFAAVAVSTFVFVALHPAQGISITQLVGGVVFAVAYEIEGNLMVPIVIHVLGNSAIFAISLIF